jgi:hypothetical protein
MALKEQFVAMLERVKAEKRPETNDAPISLEANELKAGSKKKLNFETYLKVWDVMRKLKATGRVEGSRWISFTPNRKPSKEQTTFMKLVEKAEKKATAMRYIRRPSEMENLAAKNKIQDVMRTRYEDMVIAEELDWISDSLAPYQEREAINRAHRAIHQAVMLIVEQGYLRIS